MNKKFSTLVASFLLATNVGAYAQVTPTPIDAIEMAVTGGDVKLAAYEDDPDADGFISYKVGQAYYLSAGVGEGSETSTKLLWMNEDGELKVTQETLGYDQSERSLWILKSISAPAGAVAPKYVFANKKTGAILAVDKSKAVALADIDASTPAVKVGGTSSEWLGSVSYTNPGIDNPFYIALEEDEVMTFVQEATSNNVVLAKMSKTEMADAKNKKVLVFTPRVLAENKNTFVLSPNELNTMLGKAGDNATADNYFQLSFTPTATTGGEENLWAQDLQAVAVEQFDVLYGQDASKVLKVVVPVKGETPLSGAKNGPVANDNITTGGIYTSLRPLWSEDVVEEKGKNLVVNDLLKEGVEAVNNKDGRWVALRNREGKYLVVDTVYITGTENSGKLIKFNTDDLYNSHNQKTRLRDPRSYLFQFHYNPVTNEVTIQSYGYVTECEEGKQLDTPSTPADWYAADYVTPFAKEGSEWYNGQEENGTPVAVTDAWIRRALLGSTSEVTLTTTDEAPEAENEIFKITLGSSSQLVETAVPSGAYLIKVIGSKDQTRVGKYWITNLDGSFTVMEQATRQNFQHMPSAQWIVKSTGTSAGSPVLSITNREFQKELNKGDFGDISHTGTLYVGENGGKFFMNGDELEFIPVANVADDKLGYKYVANDTIHESLFTFNYLHELAMNKPVNTLNDKDSVVWVDTKGEKVSFVLEAVIDDAYGTNGDMTRIADLTRRAYRIKVSDASKLQNDGRYLTYDAKQKKYIVSDKLVSSKDSTAVDIFFLKENNEVKGGECYYTLLQANVLPVVKVSAVNGKNQVTNRIGYMTLDADATSKAIGDEGKLYLAEYGKYTSEKDGIVAGTEGWAIRTFSKKQAEAYAKEHDLIAPTDDNLGSFTKLAATVLAGINDEFKDLIDGEKTYVLELTVGGEDGIEVSKAAANYATSKVSVDNNTLALVNGELSDNAANEVANSAFAVVRDSDPLYRYFATTDTLKFFRTNAAAPEYLYEDAHSKYSEGIGFNFLGVEGKGDNKNAAMYLDTAYVNRGTRMPQYLIALAPSIVAGEEELCTVCGKLDCEHSKVTRGYTDGRYLVNLQDSVDVYANNDDYELRSKYQYDRAYTRLGFVEARHIGDTLIIKNSVYTGDTRPLVAGFARTYASKDTINLANNMHKNAVFSFRIAKSGSDDFLIESETEGLKENSSEYEHKKNANLKAVRIAPNLGGWVKIQNGVPVIANKGIYNESGRDADIFNVEQTEEDPTANEEVAVAGVQVIGINGAVIVKNAAGKKVIISNLLGQTLASTVAASDSETISLSAGIVVVAVEGEQAVKAIVK